MQGTPPRYPWIMNAVPARAIARKIGLPPIGDGVDNAVFSVEPAPEGAIYPYIAANGAPVRLDLRKNPRRANQVDFQRHSGYSLFSRPVKELRLVCKEFPWPMEIEEEWVICGAVWSRLYDTLQEYLTDSEWALASESRRKKIDRAVRLREAETGNSNLKARRIDWLGEKTVFAGLERDDNFVQEIALPERQDNMDTWVIRMIRR
ncbi:hypothetical protein EIP86_008812 [Pleurotus ostreatoroseus]|nr:hypothetical protein EIP86_008812 [Pleurotus ostreatoroseus]